MIDINIFLKKECKYNNEKKTNGIRIVCHTHKKLLES